MCLCVDVWVDGMRMLREGIRGGSRGCRLLCVCVCVSVEDCGWGEVQVWPATETQPRLLVVAFEFLVEVKEGGGAYINIYTHW